MSFRVYVVQCISCVQNLHAFFDHFWCLFGLRVTDLKPENLLLASKDNDTDMKIADFGFAKHISEPLNTVCGTPGETSLAVGGKLETGVLE